MTRTTLVLALSAAAAATTTSAGAQGTLSTQGLGYAPGSLSTRAITTGSGIAEFDPATPINPASLSAWPATGVMVQYDPEFRTVTAGGASERTVTSRFPLIALGVRVGERLVVGVSASTMFDRTFETQQTDSTLIEGETTRRVRTDRETGGLSDVRFAASYAFGDAIRAGIGLHAITGSVNDNRLFVYPDATGTLPISAQTRATYTGTAVSGGVETRLGKALGVAVSGALGGTLRRRNGNDVLATAKVPARFGAGVRFDGITGATLSANVDWDKWSALDGINAASASARDGWRAGGGADVAGPRFAGRTILLRAGGQVRALPFAEPGATRAVREVAFAGGFGVPLAYNRAMLDAGLQHAKRTGSVSSVGESAWTLSVGFTLRP